MGGGYLTSPNNGEGARDENQIVVKDPNGQACTTMNDKRGQEGGSMRWLGYETEKLDGIGMDGSHLRH